MTNKNIVEKFIQNGVELEVPTPKVYVIDESMVTVSTTKTYGKAPYNTSYYYTNIVVNENAGIQWEEGAIYVFIIDTTMVVASSYRNVRIKIGSSGNYIPLMASGNSILAGSSYFTKARMDIYVYKTTYQSGGALHMNNDTSYSAMSVAEGKTATATSSRIVRSDYLKQIIDYHAGNLDNNKVDKITGTASLDRAYITKADGTQSNYNVSQGASSNAIVRRSGTQIVVPETPTDNTHATSKKYVDDAVASAGAGNMSSLVQFGRTWWRGTKAMFEALPNKDVNGVYVILSERDYKKMIND